MKLVRLKTRDGIRYGVIKGGAIYEVQGDIFEGLRMSGRSFPLEGANLLPPVQPGKVVGVAYNYREHAQERGLRAPKEPQLFLKPPSAVTAPGSRIPWPPLSKQVEFEGELAVVIGRPAKNIDMKYAQDYILGLTCANDVTARDLQLPGSQWALCKGFDGFLPLGPCVVTGLDYKELQLTVSLNGKVRQQANMGDMLFGIPELVGYVSRVMTLLPGDVILTGTPAGSAPMRRGDEVSVEIGGIGTLRNTMG
ncbi:MAG: DUF2437 domain-containing protein [Clostridiales bacterium]|uniref:2-keto-4-pentenoate hydratase/2-oxohepta-3-ene-1,7-dioic acid hydratase in catechol pathway n=1 Tax=Harryflintia acetispora TaxID=1849041 RepID=A0A9X8Y8E7_9FIRM|nr:MULTISPECIES: fumarylacetoacetate hydrolase family protein [Oscillospiraceae]PWM38668.1 MAG: DUF2437 domain-containing protein [Clostridiales bacterium]RGB68296.1 DUF2437 domain-containing protein [Harryflintia acetispora]TCL43768.1 2-keto-4-pentenoate hydratase/2-oxohepta-3-ene-1,7-dioic acid hydratase in catechol pathway [Harryflintia acetispora]